MDIKAMIKEILAEEQLGSLCITDQTETDIETDDFHEDRIVCYHIVPPTKDWLRSRFLFAPSCKELEPLYLERCVEILMDTDPNMLITLNRVIFMSEYEDIAAVCNAADQDPEGFPEQLSFEDDSDPVGMTWNLASSVIINMRAINGAVAEEAAEYERDGLYLNEATAIAEGVYITLLHEVRHQGLSNPFLSNEEYAACQESEEAVETWARAEYERITERR